MAITSERKLYRIGVDGGTNTDAVVACRMHSAHASNIPGDVKQKVEIVASGKSQTTPDVTIGIKNAIQTVLAATRGPHDAVISVKLGTTHFINAVVQADSANLTQLLFCGCAVLLAGRCLRSQDFRRRYVES
ncbi:hypothetical protein TOPH_09140 [Tolypocladium ophioglossoides CBS 100239]|uniref:Hydantoinase/oxoprolinase N-terminal domain-containing protein n=1 Tax=Tolypocladium ophioglossoides (strain CBS 100239) TaxID=1163406 RepID=A0A0L0MWJ5_TOLOC|nr:hypothetical protein TOPH_09140 [Tolypocladium ophioglossoides CBS 100239]